VNEDLGTVTAFVVGLTAALLALVGLVHDGGRLVTAHLRVADHAGAAARTGAQELVGLRAGRDVLDVELAGHSARRVLGRYGASGEVIATPTAVTVTVRSRVNFELLPLVGLTGREVSATRTAVAVRR
jgi:Flp pilus assembly protein TadG